jgi:hypothetical protein
LIYRAALVVADESGHAVYGFDGDQHAAILRDFAVDRQFDCTHLLSLLVIAAPDR